MKVAVVLTVCLLVSGANANGFTDFFANLGAQLKTTFAPLIDQGKQVAGTLLTTAAQAGTQLAGQALTTLAASLLNPGGTSTGTGTQPQPAVMPVNTRSLLSNFVDHAGAQLQQVTQHITDQFQNLQTLTHAGLDKLHELATQIGLPDFDPAKLAQQVQTTVQAHSGLVDGIFGNVVNHIKTALANVAAAHPTAKRNGFTDALSAAGQGIASFFQPHIDTLKGIFSGIGTAIAQAGHQVAGQLSGSVSALGTKLAGHLSAVNGSAHAILQHGTNALSALKDAVSDILQQTLVNIQPHVQNIVDTGKNALGVTANHIVSTLGTALNTQPQTTN